MKLYLSSYQLGRHGEHLAAMIDNPRVACFSNGLDGATPSHRKASECLNISLLQKIGLSPQVMDLRDYFGHKEALIRDLEDYGCVRFSGGNTFVLRKAMYLGGFDQIIARPQKRADFVYAGYSAGVCLLGSTLRGLDLVDDPHDIPYEDKATIREGLELLPYTIIPHYCSDHPEAADVEKAVDYRIENKIPFKALKDGAVIISEI